MKKLLVLLMIGFQGCAHVWVESWKDNEYEVCGNRWADVEAVKEKADQSCHGDAVAVGSHFKEIGSTVSAYYGQAHVTPKRYQCLVYQCRGPANAPSQPAPNPGPAKHP